MVFIFLWGTTPLVEWHPFSWGANGQGSTCPNVIVPSLKPEPWKCWFMNKERTGEWSPVFGKGRHRLSFKGFAKGRGQREEMWNMSLSDQASKHRKFQSNLNNTARIKTDKQNQEEIEEEKMGRWGSRGPQGSMRTGDKRFRCGEGSWDNSLQGSRKARRHEGSGHCRLQMGS